MKVLKLAAVCLLLAGCSSKPEKVGEAAQSEPAKPEVVRAEPKTIPAPIEAKQVAAEQASAYVVEIEFPKKSANLGPEAKAKLLALYKSVRQPELLKAVKVISWSDEEYPSPELKKLTSPQRDLAKRRGQSVENIFKRENAKLKFEIYNMAERPGKLSKLMGGAETRVKESLEKAEAGPKARKAIVMLMMDGDKS